jgi:hypothetical protein
MLSRTAFALFASSSRMAGRGTARRSLFILAVCRGGSLKGVLIRAPVLFFAVGVIDWQ